MPLTSGLYNDIPFVGKFYIGPQPLGLGHLRLSWKSLPVASGFHRLVTAKPHAIFRTSVFRGVPRRQNAVPGVRLHL